MRKIFFAVLASVTLLSIDAAKAQEPRSLKVVMKEMSQVFKAIARQVNDPEANRSSAALSHQLGSLIIEGRAMAPASIATLPPAQQVEAIKGYQQQMDDLGSECTKMEAAFQANDNQGAKAALTRMNEMKSKGHDDFKG
jgi:hypothetical protein